MLFTTMWTPVPALQDSSRINYSEIGNNWNCYLLKIERYRMQIIAFLKLFSFTRNFTKLTFTSKQHSHFAYRFDGTSKSSEHLCNHATFPNQKRCCENSSVWKGRSPNKLAQSGWLLYYATLLTNTATHKVPVLQLNQRRSTGRWQKWAKIDTGTVWHTKASQWGDRWEDNRTGKKQQKNNMGTGY